MKSIIGNNSFFSFFYIISQFEILGYLEDFFIYLSIGINSFCINLLEKMIFNNISDTAKNFKIVLMNLGVTQGLTL